MAISQYLVNPLLPGSCNESDLEGNLRQGCDLLAGGGYVAIRVVPTLIMVAFVLLARWRGRLGWVYAGFALTLALLITLAVTTPDEYPL